jgi:hypothetical protein
LELMPKFCAPKKDSLFSGHKINWRLHCFDMGESVMKIDFSKAGNMTRFRFGEQLHYWIRSESVENEGSESETGKVLYAILNANAGIGITNNESEMILDFTLIPNLPVESRKSILKKARTFLETEERRALHDFQGWGKEGRASNAGQTFMAWVEGTRSVLSCIRIMIGTVELEEQVIRLRTANEK